MREYNLQMFAVLIRDRTTNGQSCNWVLANTILMQTGCWLAKKSKKKGRTALRKSFLKSRKKGLKGNEDWFPFPSVHRNDQKRWPVLSISGKDLKMATKNSFANFMSARLGGQNDVKHEPFVHKSYRRRMNGGLSQWNNGKDLHSWSLIMIIPPPFLKHHFLIKYSLNTRMIIYLFIG